MVPKLYIRSFLYTQVQTTQLRRLSLQQTRHTTLKMLILKTK